jgi:hypothetical protein
MERRMKLALYTFPYSMVREEKREGGGERERGLLEQTQRSPNR